MNYTISKTSTTNYQAERDDHKDYISAARVKTLVKTIEQRHPEAEIFFDDASRVDYYLSLDGDTIEELAAPVRRRLAL